MVFLAEKTSSKPEFLKHSFILKGQWRTLLSQDNISALALWVSFDRLGPNMGKMLDCLVGSAQTAALQKAPEMHPERRCPPSAGAANKEPELRVSQQGGHVLISGTPTCVEKESEMHFRTDKNSVRW